MKRQLVFCLVLVLCPAGAWADPTWHLYELYGTDHPGLKAITGSPSLNNAGQVAFIGAPVSTWQCFRGSGGPLTRMDDANHAASSPGSSQYPAINDLGVVSYVGTILSVTQGYRSDGTAVTHMFPSPLSTPTGTAINNSGTVATLAWDSNDAWKKGIFATTGGSTITTVAKQGTTAPQTGGGTFSDFAYGPDINDSGTVAFWGSTGTVWGIYTWSGGVLSRVIDKTSGISPNVYSPRINDNGLVAFSGKNVSNQAAIFLSTGGNTCQEVVNVPGVGLAGIYGESVALNNNGLLAYAGYDKVVSGKTGIYTAGAASSTIAVEGGTISGRSVYRLVLRPDGLNDYGQIAFAVNFTGDANWFIYVASPFPCAAPMGLSRGTGAVAYAPDGFAAGGHTTAGLGGATPLSGTVEIDSLALDGGMATVIGAYDPAEVTALGLDEATLRLYWDNAGTWVLAGRQSNLNRTTGQFLTGAPTAVLGDWGIDLGGKYVWANVDHASTFAMAGVPEPTTLSLLALGVLGLIRRRR